MAYKVGMIKKDGSVIGKRCENKTEADNYVLSFIEEIKEARIRDLNTGLEEIINFEEKKES